MAQCETAAEVRWTPELEVALFHSMHRHKPVGLNKNFHMACIQHKLQSSAGLFLTTKQIWIHLRTLYDLESLENLERFPFPNEEKDFCLPRYMFDTKGYTTAETEGVDDSDSGVQKKASMQHSSSLSPASSPISKTGNKRKRN